MKDLIDEKFVEYMLNKFKEEGESERNNYVCSQHFASDACQKMHRAYTEKGRRGWWNKNECDIEDLKRYMLIHMKKGDMRDVANFAMMIHWRILFDAIEDTP